MSNKIVFVGPPGVGKTTLRKIFFEGESSTRLLEYGLDPTYGKESIILNLSEEIGVFDLSGQENERWLESEERVIFEDTKVIIIVLDVSSVASDIIDFTKRVLEIKKEQSPDAFVYLLIHKIDVLNQKKLIPFQAKLIDAFLRENNLKIKFTSITRNYFSNALAIFVDILKTVLSEDKPIEGLDFNILKNTLLLLFQFKDKDVISQKEIKQNLLMSPKKLEKIIHSLYKKKHLELSEIGQDQVLILTETGKTHFHHILSVFNKENINKFEAPYIQSTDDLTVNKKKKMPSFVGFLLADKDGKGLMNVELFDGAFEIYLKDNKTSNKSFDVDLIPMFVSALERFSQEINISDLAGFKLKGQNLSMQIFGLEDYTITFFYNSEINIKPVKKKIQRYFENLIEKNHDNFKSCVETGCLGYIGKYAIESRKWLEDLNKIYENRTSNLDFFNPELAKNFYDDLDVLSTKIDDKFTAIKEHIKKLKIKLMKGILNEDIEQVKLIKKSINEINLKYFN